MRVAILVVLAVAAAGCSTRAMRPRDDVWSSAPAQAGADDRAGEQAPAERPGRD